MVAVDGVRWSILEGNDLHVLGGVPSRRLDEILVLEMSDDTAVFAHSPPSGVTVDFTAEFEGAPSAHGVTVDGLTGVVNVSSASLPGPRLRNFLIRADVTDPNAAQILDPVKIRVHVHSAIQAVWLTPDPLTIRPDADGFRFTLLAEFDDGTLGDLTDVRGLTWSSADPDRVEVDSETGELKAHETGAQVDITVALSTALGGHSATATVRTVVPFGQATELTWVNGKGRSSWREAFNILFLPDGFDSSEKGQFEAIVRKIAQALLTNRLTRPFDLFGNSVNYWMTFVLSPQRGISVLPEQYSRPVPPDFAVNKGGAISLPLQPSSPPATAWTSAELIHEVGLPVTADVAGRPLVGGADPVLPDLQALYGSKVTAARISAGNFASWQGTISNRVLLNELDTAFGLAQGERPRVDEGLESHWVAFNPRRTTSSFAFSHGPDLRNDLNAGFVTNVRNAFHAAGIELSKATLISREASTAPRWLVTDIDNGQVFSVRDEGLSQLDIHEKYSLKHFHAFLENLTVRSTRVGDLWTTGKDRGLVCFIARTARSGGVNFSERYFTVALGSEQEIDLVSGFDISLGRTVHLVDPMAIPSKPGLVMVGTVAHEAGHAFQFGSLGDEYVNQGRMRIPARRTKRLKIRGNLQSEKELLVDPDDLQSGLDGDKIKWARGDLREEHWPRIVVAGILKEKPSAIGAIDPSTGTHRNFEITLERNHGKPFQHLDPDAVFAYLRRRSFVKRPTLGGPLSIRRMTGDRIEVQLFGGASDVDPDDFLPGSVLLVPKQEEVAPPAFGNELPIVAPFIRAHITSSRRPLRSSRDAQGNCVNTVDLFKTRTPDNLPAGIKAGVPRYQAWIAGLYEGGDTYNCGVYHPTGVCLMRWSGLVPRDPPGGPAQLYQFCHVCRYIMVDGIDPTKHGVIDKDYEARVPELEP